jgi:Flp pilus assembly protein TadB
MDNPSDPGSTRVADMWVSKPIYESLPYFYLLAGLLSLAASMYLNHWYWPTICLAVGLACLVGGLVVLLKRRDHRSRLRRTASDAGS